MAHPHSDRDIEHIARRRSPSSLRVARAWLAARPGMPLHAALAELLASAYGRSDWLLAYWSRERLFSVDAHRAWQDPDLCAFTT